MLAGVPLSSPVDGFRLSYADTAPAGGTGRAPAVVLLHGWPGGHADYREVVPLLADRFRVVVPDLRGFGDSDRHLLDPQEFYGAAAQARSVAGLIAELGLDRPVVAGYDVGSRVAQTVAREHPEVVRALAVSPPLPGVGGRILDAASVPEYWYQHFHRTELAVSLIDGQRDQVREYLRHYWDHWSGPGLAGEGTEFERLVDAYSRPGAFEASIGWYRAGGGTVATSLAEQPPTPKDRLALPVHVLWPELDPLFPRAWSDRLDEFFADATLDTVDGVGHFTPLEAPREFAALVDRAAGT